MCSCRSSRKEVSEIATVNTDNAREVFENIGLKGAALDQALEGLANMRTTASIEVSINEGDDVKFGDVSINKVQPNGYSRTAMGLRTAQIPEFVANLVVALEELDSEAHAALVSSFTGGE